MVIFIIWSPFQKKTYFALSTIFPQGVKVGTIIAVFVFVVIDRCFALRAAAAAAFPPTDQAHAAWLKKQAKRQEGGGEPKPAAKSSSVKQVRPKPLFVKKVNVLK